MDSRDPRAFNFRYAFGRTMWDLEGGAEIVRHMTPTPKSRGVYAPVLHVQGGLLGSPRRVWPGTLQQLLDAGLVREARAGVWVLR